MEGSLKSGFCKRMLRIHYNFKNYIIYSTIVVKDATFTIQSLCRHKEVEPRVCLNCEFGSSSKSRLTTSPKSWTTS